MKLELAVEEETTVLPFGHQYSKGGNVKTVGAIHTCHASIGFCGLIGFPGGQADLAPDLVAYGAE